MSVSAADVSGDEDEPDAPSQERVTVKFARPESDKVKQAREKSYHYLKKRQDEMPWLPTTVHKRNSAGSEVRAVLAARRRGRGGRNAAQLVPPMLGAWRDCQTLGGVCVIVKMWCCSRILAYGLVMCATFGQLFYI